jgi:HD-like signal output (HDOD) protein
MASSAAAVAESIASQIKIPPQPEVLRVAKQEAAKESPDLLTIAKAVRKDLSLSAGVLTIVNSPQLALPTKIVSIAQAVSYLGLEPTISLIATVELRRVFKQVAGLSMERFWDTATDEARHAASISRTLGIGRPEEMYTVGLFHDCGIPLLAQKFPDYKSVLQEANKAEHFTAVEERVYQTNHAIVGYYLARAWNLPPLICDAVLHHDDIEEILGSEAHKRSALGATIAILAFATHVNDLYRKRDEPSWQKVKDLVLDCLGLTEDRCEELTSELMAMQASFN